VEGIIEQRAVRDRQPGSAIVMRGQQPVRVLPTKRRILGELVDGPIAKDPAAGQADRPALRIDSRPADAQICAQSRFPRIPARETIGREQIALIEFDQAAILVRDIVVTAARRPEKLYHRLDYMRGAAGISGQGPAKFDTCRWIGAENCILVVTILRDVVKIRVQPQYCRADEATRKDLAATPVQSERGSGDVAALHVF